MRLRNCLIYNDLFALVNLKLISTRRNTFASQHLGMELSHGSTMLCSSTKINLRRNRACRVLSLDHIRKQLHPWTNPGWISVTFKPFLLWLMVEKQLTFDPVHTKWQVWLSLVLIWATGRHSTMKLDWDVYHERERDRSYQMGSLCFPEESSPFLWQCVNWEYLHSHVSIIFNAFIHRPPDTHVHS